MATTNESAKLTRMRLEKKEAGLKLLDQPAEKIYPMPLLVTADPAVHVGRVRVLPGAADRATFFISVDNAGRGAGLNAVDIGARVTSWRA